MFRVIFFLSLVCLFFQIGQGDIFAGILPEDSRILGENSIKVNNPSGGADLIEVSRSFGFKILGVLKVVVSGFALVYLVLIGVYMIIFSETEDRIKTQRRQIIYALVGFLFLNIPGTIYKVFFGDTLGNVNRPSENIGGTTTNILFWRSDALSGNQGFVSMMVSFFEVFIFGVAIMTFTWGFFQLIISGGDEEKQKSAKGRIIYGVLGLIFVAFAKTWSSVISDTTFSQARTLTEKAFGIALYFAGPVAIFFLILAGYYYITAGGNEERTKKAKNILINTFIACLILLGMYSFVSDLAESFQI